MTFISHLTSIKCEIYELNIQWEALMRNCVLLFFCLYWVSIPQYLPKMTKYPTYTLETA